MLTDNRTLIIDTLDKTTGQYSREVIILDKPPKEYLLIEDGTMPYKDNKPNPTKTKTKKEK